MVQKYRVEVLIIWARRPLREPLRCQKPCIIGFSAQICPHADARHYLRFTMKPSACGSTLCLPRLAHPWVRSVEWRWPWAAAREPCLTRYRDAAVRYYGWLYGCVVAGPWAVAFQQGPAARIAVGSIFDDAPTRFRQHIFERWSFGRFAIDSTSRSGVDFLSSCGDEKGPRHKASYWMCCLLVRQHDTAAVYTDRQPMNMSKAQIPAFGLKRASR